MKKTILLTSLIISVCAFAGELAVTQFGIDAGGGTSAGGQFTVTGTVGQPEAEPMVGGTFVVQGGSWSAYSVVGTVGAPRLTISFIGATAVLSWPAGAGAFQLQSNSDLTVANGWVNVSQSAVTANGLTSVTIPVTPGKKFFRLKN